MRDQIDLDKGSEDNVARNTDPQEYLSANKRAVQESCCSLGIYSKLFTKSLTRALCLGFSNPRHPGTFLASTKLPSQFPNPMTTGAHIQLGFIQPYVIPANISEDIIYESVKDINS